MSNEVKLANSAKNMFDFSKETVSRNLLLAIKSKKIGIELEKFPGLEKIIHSSIDEAFRNSISELTSLAKK